MANPVLGKSLCSDWFFLGQDFAVRTVSMETVQSVYFVLERSRQIQNLLLKQRKKSVNIVILHVETTRRSWKDWNFSGIFKCKLRAVHFTIRNRVPFNKLLTNLAFSSCTGEYWPTVVFVQTSLRSVRTVTTSGQYSPVRPSRSVSKQLIFPCSFVEFCNFAWIMRFLTNYAKSSDLRLILWNRNIAEYQKPCNNNINNNNNNNNINHLQKVIVQKSQ